MSNDSKSKKKMDKEFMNVKELTEYLGVKRSTVYSWSHKNLLPYYKMNNRTLFFKKNEVDNFIFNSNNYHKSMDQLRAEVFRESLRRNK